MTDETRDIDPFPKEMQRLKATLKPCPFCGAPPKPRITNFYQDRIDGRFAICRTPMCPLFNKQFTETEWQTRSDAEVLDFAKEYGEALKACTSTIKAYHDKTEALEQEIKDLKQAIYAGKEIVAARDHEIESLTKSHTQLYDALELAYRWIRVTGLGYGLTSNPDYVAVTEYLEKIRGSTLVVRKYGK